jgi:hypothetical protein
MAESTHRVEIVPVTLEPHDNADALSIVKIEGYQAVVRTQDWKHVEPCSYAYAAIPAIYPPPPCECGHPLLGAYVPPDSLVPVDRPEFAFLADPKRPDKTVMRVTARRLRGEWSMGVLIPAPAGFAAGEDAAEFLGVTHYDPPEPSAGTGGETERPPKVRRKCVACEGTGWTKHPTFGNLPVKTCAACDGKGYPNDTETVGFTIPKYDVEAFRKYGRHAFVEGELVRVTEKIHGSNGRWLYDGERYYCGSHKEWKRESATNLWWNALRNNPALGNFLFMNPGTVVYGEVYGQVQDLKYGTKPGEIRIAVFDILHEGDWVSAEQYERFQPNPEGPPAWTLPWVPLIALCEFEFNLVLGLADGKTLVPGAEHVREGIVVKPLRERWDSKCGRVNLKVVSNFYHERAK